MRIIAAIALLVTVTIGFTWSALRPAFDHPPETLLTREPITSSGRILDIERYDDPGYGFSFAIPAGWTRIVAAPADEVDVNGLFVELEPGYAVGFESPRAGSHDRFADYILVELLPGDEYGLFDTTEAQQYFMQPEQQGIAYDRLTIDSALDEAVDVDLVIFQRGVQAFGYTLAFYAIGEPANEQLMLEAFQIMIQTFVQNEAPFVII